MDVDAVIARAPELALVDELAHTNAAGNAEREALPGHRRDPRRRHRRHLDGQRPAPREPERRHLRADGSPRPRDLPRPDPRRGGRGRARRPLARGAPGAAAAPARSIRASGPRSRSRTSSGRRTSPRCASSCCARWPRTSRRGAERPSSSRSASRRSASACSRWSSRSPSHSGSSGAPGARRSASAPTSTRSGCGPAAREPDGGGTGTARCATPARRRSSACHFLEDRRRRPGRDGRQRRPRARLDVHLRRHARRVAATRDPRRLAPLAHRARDPGHRHPRRRRPGPPREAKRMSVVDILVGLLVAAVAILGYSWCASLAAARASPEAHPGSFHRRRARPNRPRGRNPDRAGRGGDARARVL